MNRIYIEPEGTQLVCINSDAYIAITIGKTYNLINLLSDVYHITKCEYSMGSDPFSNFVNNLIRLYESR